MQIIRKIGWIYASTIWPSLSQKYSWKCMTKVGGSELCGSWGLPFIYLLSAFLSDDIYLKWNFSSSSKTLFLSDLIMNSASLIMKSSRRFPDSSSSPLLSRIRLWWCRWDLWDEFQTVVLPNRIYMMCRPALSGAGINWCSSAFPLVPPFLQGGARWDGLRKKRSSWSLLQGHIVTFRKLSSLSSSSFNVRLDIIISHISLKYWPLGAETKSVFLLASCWMHNSRIKPQNHGVSSVVKHNENI